MRLLARHGLTVFTNSIVNCGKLAGHNKNRVYMLGGEVQAINGATLGRDAMTMLAHYFADFVFVGAGAISPTGWLMDYTREEGELHSQMLQSARTAVVVADHSKFNRYAPVRARQLREGHPSGHRPAAGTAGGRRAGRAAARAAGERWPAALMGAGAARPVPSQGGSP